MLVVDEDVRVGRGVHAAVDVARAVDLDRRKERRDRARRADRGGHVGCRRAFAAEGDEPSVVDVQRVDPQRFVRPDIAEQRPEARGDVIRRHAADRHERGGKCARTHLAAHDARQHRAARYGRPAAALDFVALGNRADLGGARGAQPFAVGRRRTTGHVVEEVFGREPGAHERRHDRPGRRPHDEIRVARIPLARLGQRA